jgi:hypothetical protein
MAQEINRGPGPDPTPDGPPDKPGPAGQRAQASGQPRAQARNREAAANSRSGSAFCCLPPFGPLVGLARTVLVIAIAA